MKKEYVKPATDIVEMEVECMMIAASRVSIGEPIEELEIEIKERRGIWD
ncbi:MAG: hypothetical protein IKD25_03595 [Bacteroidaceae bacterium]|nr:hypothetical protein [Bacteroidaceae bacterium]